MVIPWVGYSLSEFINPLRAAPLRKIRAVHLPSKDSKDEILPWSAGISWPYYEGLRMDEAMHPLTLLTFGLYGQALP